MILFETMTPLGTRIRTTESYWAKLITLKHPSMRGREIVVQETLRAPEQIRRSRADRSVLLYYSSVGDYHVCVVVKVLNGDGFIITAYKTVNIKEGEKIWPG